MNEPLRLRNLAQFRTVVSSEGGLVITDTAKAPMFHADPKGCDQVRESHFETKVITNAEWNGSYFAVPSLVDARARWPSAVRCQSAACTSASEAAIAGTAGGSGADRLRTALGAATGSNAVRARRRPPIGVETLMPGWTSTQRIALGELNGELVLCTWPAELKSQARAVYGTAVGEAVVELAEGSAEWSAEPLPHLAFNGSGTDDRFYFRCPLSLPEYVRRWSRPEDLSEVRGHPADTVRSSLWPWLCERGYADPDDPANQPKLDRYMQALERRRSQAHLRPSIAMRRKFLDRNEERLHSEATAAMANLAEALEEELPAHADSNS